MLPEKNVNDENLYWASISFTEIAGGAISKGSKCGGSIEWILCYGNGFPSLLSNVKYINFSLRKSAPNGGDAGCRKRVSCQEPRPPALISAFQRLKTSRYPHTTLN